ncbi:hypothetical protein [Salirhabdus salicampi]|uniref:hypothetical protein n=1 Tax=Salirhabdus salicampi TaxID=476102 RepID=UPI0020C235CB|nr:hypothetical protein [Salirhabdus salicampi]MCP8616849.1 hypothetical protein [Salirhabdus salicampi]
MFRKQNNGFMLMDTIISVTLLFTCILFLVPGIVQIRIEQERWVIKNEMLTYLNQQLKVKEPMEGKVKVRNKAAHIYIQENGNTLHGCITWTTIKDEEDSICLIGAGDYGTAR